MKRSIILVSLAIVGMAFTVRQLPAENVKTVTAQAEAGIKFKTIPLEKAKEMAAEKDKLIFIDAYTSWCGPCKRMAATSFQEAEVGKIFNDRFVNLKIDMEQDADGPEVARLYKVRAYPTLLVIDSKGKLIKQGVGFMTADQLIAFANSIE
ncbi:MAG: thioredoxin family protein [Bacteroidota bacterium]|jgi:thiol:disulfide interchange protein